MPEPSLERISQLVKLLDEPNLTYPSIHITGTNGKTTTARLVTGLACAHGLSTGTYISPHVERVTERLSICAEAISEEEFAEEYTRLAPYLESAEGLGAPITYFEALTALAYVWFADKPVSLGVFEVGMGGTWDATNLVAGDVAILCPVGLDHVQHLGKTVEEIAGEKAGIIKPSKVAVVRDQRPEAQAVIERQASEVGTTLLLEGRDFAVESRSPAVGGQTFSMRGVHGSYETLFLPLFGEPAARNAAAAVAALEAFLDRPLHEPSVAQAFEAVTSPGRVEVVSRHPLVILDGAHNPDAAEALVEAVREAFHWERLHLVAGMFEDKDVEEVIRRLAPLADRGYACLSSSGRAASPERVAEAMRGAGLADVDTFGSVASAVESARSEASAEDLILVTGSFYTVGDARPLFEGARP